MTVGTHPMPSQLLDSCSEGMMFCLGQWAYNVTDGLWWTAMLIGFMFALFMGAQNFGRNRAFGFSTMTGLLGSLFLATLGYMSWNIATIFILLGCVGVAAMLISDR